MQITENQIAVHESKKSDKVVKFINVSKLSHMVQCMMQDNTLHGIYFKKDRMVAEDIWGETYDAV